MTVKCLQRNYSLILKILSFNFQLFVCLFMNDSWCSLGWTWTQYSCLIQVLGIQVCVVRPGLENGCFKVLGQVDTEARILPPRLSKSRKLGSLLMQQTVLQGDPCSLQSCAWITKCPLGASLGLHFLTNQLVSASLFLRFSYFKTQFRSRYCKSIQAFLKRVMQQSTAENETSCTHRHGFLPLWPAALRYESP